MEQKTEASQAVDDTVERGKFVTEYLRYMAKEAPQSHPEMMYSMAHTRWDGIAGVMWRAGRAALKAQPAPTEAAQNEPFEQVTIADAKFAIKQMQNFVNTDTHLCLLLDANIDTLRTFVHGRAEAALAERMAAAAQGNTSNNSSSSQLSGNSGELQPSGNTGELAQGEDSTRLDWIEKSAIKGATYKGITSANVIVREGEWHELGLRAAIDAARARASAETGGVKS